MNERANGIEVENSNSCLKACSNQQTNRGSANEGRNEQQPRRVLEQRSASVQQLALIDLGHRCTRAIDCFAERKKAFLTIHALGEDALRDRERDREGDPTDEHCGAGQAVETRGAVGIKQPSPLAQFGPFAQRQTDCQAAVGGRLK